MTAGFGSVTGCGGGGAGNGGNRPARPGKSRVAASARPPSTRPRPGPASFLIAPCGTPGKGSRNQRSSLISASSSETVLVAPGLVASIMSGLAGKVRRFQLVAVRILDEGPVIHRHLALARPRGTGIGPAGADGRGVEC